MSEHSQLVLTRIAQRGDAGHVAYVTINNPDKRNALGMPGKRAIASAFDALSRDEALRAVVITGTGERSFINAEEAWRCGYLEKLVPAAELDAVVEAWIESILACGQRAVRLQKALVRDWERMPVANAIQRGIQACVEARRTDEPRRMMAAFLERKKK